MNYLNEAKKVANKLNIELIILDSEFKKHFSDDKQERYVFKCKLKRGKRSFTFNFGQSLHSGSEEPNIYDVLVCLQKYDVGTFNDFCDNFGYDSESIKANRIYKDVLKEYKNMQRLFNDSELEILQEII